ncbi:MAG: hypothetical protein ACHBN1_07695 [Heteroscytonema crispum UTEX LB 1556]
MIVDDDEIAISIVQHPPTKRWQTWASLDGKHIICLTAHSDRYDGVLTALDIAMAWKLGNLTTPQEVTAFFQDSPSDGAVEPLPQNVSLRLSQLL